MFEMNATEVDATITLSAAVDELFEAGPETLARAIEEEETGLPALGELRPEAEGIGKAARLRRDSARFLVFVETHLLSRESFGVHRLLRATHEVPRSNTTHPSGDGVQRLWGPVEG